MCIKKLTLVISISLIILAVVFSEVLAADNEHDIKSAGAKVEIISENAKNIYAAGARVSIKGKAEKSIWAAGALVNINTKIGDDLYAAGSHVNVKGIVIGKARLAGADLIVDAEIGEVLNAAAASIKISEHAKIPSNSSLAAALIEFRGTVKDNLSLYADEVIFSGQAAGSVTIEGRNVQLSETAHIDGDLTIRSSNKAVISPNATVVGKLTQTGLENSAFLKKHEHDSNGRGIILLFSFSIFLLGLMLIIFARGFMEQSITMLRKQPVRSILWGLFVFLAAPIFIVVTMITVIGIPISVATLMLLPFLLILGFSTATLGISNWIFNRNNKPGKLSYRLLLMAVGVVILVILGFIPLIGGLLIFLALLLVLGAATATLGYRLKATSID